MSEDWAKRKRKSAREQRSMRMLREFLNAKTAPQKRQIIKECNPYHYIFGNKLDPRNPYEQGENHESV